MADELWTIWIIPTIPIIISVIALIMSFRKGYPRVSTEHYNLHRFYFPYAVEIYHPFKKRLVYLDPPKCRIDKEKAIISHGNEKEQDYFGIYCEVCTRRTGKRNMYHGKGTFDALRYRIIKEIESRRFFIKSLKEAEDSLLEVMER